MYRINHKMILISDTRILKGSSSLSCAVHIVRGSILKITVIRVCSVFTGDDYDDDRYTTRLVRGLAAVYTRFLLPSQMRSRP